MIDAIHIPKAINMKPEQLLAVVANAAKMTVADYGRKSKARKYVWLRYTAAYLVKQNYNGFNERRIAELFGDFHRTTIICGLQQVQDYLDTADEKYADYLNNIKSHLLTLCESQN